MLRDRTKKGARNIYINPERRYWNTPKMRIHNMPVPPTYRNKNYISVARTSKYHLSKISSFALR